MLFIWYCIIYFVILFIYIIYYFKYLVFVFVYGISLYIVECVNKFKVLMVVFFKKGGCYIV